MRRSFQRCALCSRPLYPLRIRILYPSKTREEVTMNVSCSTCDFSDLKIIEETSEFRLVICQHDIESVHCVLCGNVLANTERPLSLHCGHCKRYVHLIGEAD